ncbi:MAG: hypothetical protein NVS9B15_11610 [Acidobacteriaceae bacterium]
MFILVTRKIGAHLCTPHTLHNYYPLGEAARMLRIGRRFENARVYSWFGIPNPEID